jgi:hypothetical protein
MHERSSGHLRVLKMRADDHEQRRPRVRSKREADVEAGIHVEIVVFGQHILGAVRSSRTTQTGNLRRARRDLFEGQ